MRSFVNIKPSRNGKITLSFIDIGKSCLNREFLLSLICLLILFAKIKFSRKFPNIQYLLCCLQHTCHEVRPDFRDFSSCFGFESGHMGFENFLEGAMRLRMGYIEDLT